MTEDVVTEDVQSLSFRRSGKKVATAAAIAFACVVLQSIGTARASSRLEGFPQYVTFVVLGSGAFACLIAAFYLLYRLTSLKPVLLITEEGVVDRSSPAGVGLIRWEEIVAVEPLFVSGQLFITLRTRDPEAVISRQRSRIKRWVLRSSDRKGWGVAVITANVLPVSAEEVLRALRQRLPAA